MCFLELRKPVQVSRGLKRLGCIFLLFMSCLSSCLFFGSRIIPHPCTLSNRTIIVIVLISLFLLNILARSHGLLPVLLCVDGFGFNQFIHQEIPTHPSHLPGRSSLVTQDRRD